MPEPVAYQQSSMKGPNVTKRIVVCCDGTWQDGLVVSQRWKYTNVLRLARILNHTDERYSPHIPQVVFYQSGVGTWGDKVIEQLDGIVGASLADKVQEGYAFIAHNYRPGDEIFLFGFSRGAYTARMIALLIGAIGVLDRTEMDQFADIFMTYQKRGKAQDPTEIATLDQKLAPWTAHTSPGKIRADSGPNSFSIKCVGVFDTVGSLGLPEELTHSTKIKTLFGFPDRYLGEHVENAFQALALDEHRKDFNCAKFEQTKGGERKGQVLKQCWFAGSHCDIGGGFEDHDLSDVALTWMVSNISDILSVDHHYLRSLPDPVAQWGEMTPHNSATGIFELAETIQRTIPTQMNDVTHEMIHPSVLRQHKVHPEIIQAVRNAPELLWRLHPHEEIVREHWQIKRASTDSAPKHDKNPVKALGHLLHRAETDIVGSLSHKDKASSDPDGLLKFAEEHSMGSVVKEIMAERD